MNEKIFDLPYMKKLRTREAVTKVQTHIPPRARTRDNMTKTH
jgi:hypothetical protein